ncbi:MAG: ATP-binding protein [Acidimicrobiia bacterium]
MGVEGPDSSRRWAAAFFGLCLGGSIFLGVGYVASRHSHDHELLSTRAQAVSLAIETMVDDAGYQAIAVAALFRGSVEVTEGEFNGFVQDVGLTEGMFGLGFIPIVPRADLAEFEEELARGHPGAFVFEVDGTEPVPVGVRDTYFPIRFFWSKDQLPAWGFDAGSDPEFASAIDQTLNSLQLTMSEFFRFSSNPGRDGFVIFEPAFGPDGLLLGVVAVAMDLDAVLAAALPPDVGLPLALAVHDVTDGSPPVPEGTWSESISAASRAWRVDVNSQGHDSYIWGALAFIAGGLAMGTATTLAALALGTRARHRNEVARLRILDREKDDFLAVVSHELRTPLTSIVGFADALRGGDGELTRADQVEMIDFIADEADAMEGIVQDLLVVARLQQGGVVPITCRAIDDLAAEVTKIADQAAVVRSSPTTVSGNAAAFADPARLRQILRNLFDNSVRHGLPPIAVTIEADGEQVRVRVKDSGPGVGAVEVPKLFDRYRSGPNPEGLPTSTGIGLWLSRELARLMGGDLRLVVTGKGATFELTLPAATGGGQCVIEPAALAGQAVGF